MHFSLVRAVDLHLFFPMRGPPSLIALLSVLAFTLRKSSIGVTVVLCPPWTLFLLESFVQLHGASYRLSFTEKFYFGLAWLS